MLDQIRKALKDQGGPLYGVVEVDAGYVGGVNQKNEKKFLNKAALMVAVKRNVEMRAEAVPDLTRPEVQKFLHKNVKQGSILLTDNASSYKTAAFGYDRMHVNHGKGEYERGGVHINRVETFFSHLKRSLKGTHKSISKAHLQSYLDGFVFHYNMRHSDKMRFDALFGALLRFGEQKGTSSGSLAQV